MRIMSLLRYRPCRCSLAPALLLVLAAWGGQGAFSSEPDPGDQAIADQVKDELLFHPGVNSALVDVATQDGVVTLSGWADSLEAKRRAARIARTVEEVRRVVNRIQVDPVQDRPDAALRTSVIASLEADPATEAYELEVDVDGGVVTLRGRVESWQEKQLAGQVAGSVAGVTGLINKVKIEPRTDRPDGEIQKEIQRALEADALLKGDRIGVVVDEGEVTLQGTVISAARKRRAVAKAWVPGATAVDARKLTVEPPGGEPPPPDQVVDPLQSSEVRKAIGEALERSARVSPFDVRVELSEHTATLRGTVDNLQAKRAAAKLVAEVRGVASVKNRIKVRPEKRPEDEQLEKELREALRRDPAVSRFQIEADARNGTVHLFGGVDSAFDKAEAEDVAAGIVGVADVKNHLTVTDRHASYVYNPYVDETDPSQYDWYEYRSEGTGSIKSDTEIEDAIREEISWTPELDDDQLSVTVENEIAAFEGTVDSPAERQAVLQDVMEGGAVAVKNWPDVVYD